MSGLGFWLLACKESLDNKEACVEPLDPISETENPDLITYTDGENFVNIHRDLNADVGDYLLGQLHSCRNEIEDQFQLVSPHPSLSLQHVLPGEETNGFGWPAWSQAPRIWSEFDDSAENIAYINSIVAQIPADEYNICHNYSAAFTPAIALEHEITHALTNDRIHIEPLEEGWAEYGRSQIGSPLPFFEASVSRGGADLAPGEALVPSFVDESMRLAKITFIESEASGTLHLGYDNVTDLTTGAIIYGTGHVPKNTCISIQAAALGIPIPGLLCNQSLDENRYHFEVYDNRGYYDDATGLYAFDMLPDCFDSEFTYKSYALMAGSEEPVPLQVYAGRTYPYADDLQDEQYATGFCLWEGYGKSYGESAIQSVTQSLLNFAADNQSKTSPAPVLDIFAESAGVSVTEMEDFFTTYGAPIDSENFVTGGVCVP